MNAAQTSRRHFGAMKRVRVVIGRYALGDGSGSPTTASIQRFRANTGSRESAWRRDVLMAIEDADFTISYA
jgi:hypothetical protein